MADSGGWTGQIAPQSPYFDPSLQNGNALGSPVPAPMAMNALGSMPGQVAQPGPIIQQPTGGQGGITGAPVSAGGPMSQAPSVGAPNFSSQIPGLGAPDYGVLHQASPMPAAPSTDGVPGLGSPNYGMLHRTSPMSEPAPASVPGLGQPDYGALRQTQQQSPQGTPGSFVGGLNAMFPNHQFTPVDHDPFAGGPAL